MENRCFLCTWEVVGSLPDDSCKTLSLGWYRTFRYGNVRVLRRRSRYARVDHEDDDDMQEDIKILNGEPSCTARYQGRISTCGKINFVACMGPFFFGRLGANVSGARVMKVCWKMSDVCLSKNALLCQTMTKVICVK